MTEFKKALIRENRFEPTPSVLWVDRIMNHLIKVGGIGVILSVAGIFVFILSQILPLFAGAKVEHFNTIALDPQKQFKAMAVDEWAELPLLLDQNGFAQFIDVHSGEATPANHLSLFDEKTITGFRYHQDHHQIVYGTSDGNLSIVNVLYRPNFENGQRIIVGSIEEEARISLGEDALPIIDIAYGGEEEDSIALLIQEDGVQRRISAVRFERERTLFGSGDLEVSEIIDISDRIKGNPTSIGVSSNADNFYVVTDHRRVHCFSLVNNSVDKIQTFTPFKGKSSENIQTIDYLLGGVSLVLTNVDGLNEVYSLFRPAGERRRLYGKIKEFKSLPGAPETYAASMRNKSFLIAGSGYASLRHSTTKSIRWEAKVPFDIRLSAISGKHQKILFLDSQNQLQIYTLNDPHPEAGIRAYFSKIWYEGASFPKYEWQSTGGTDQFEPKLSLVPLIVGSLKGTFYSLLLALPISILAAIYTSQFAHPKFKNIVKPVMEIMASLPSVVLGFMAALWLAPLIEYQVVSVLLMAITLPLAMLITGTVWTCLPRAYTAWLKSGYELIVAFPVILFTLWMTWQLGPWVESIFFTVTDASGQSIADFRLWWAAVSHANFEQRNSLVVGFMMGFAVIPIIFTITEDALSNVAPSLRSGSLALGASRWQTALRVILPTASAGILSAVMIGFGRAVGETMIVVMATGNTPIMDLNIFSGMRTLSANIAVELPEAPYHGTLYRSLFLGALALFLMTFVLNTLAEVLREKLRKKYKTT